MQSVSGERKRNQRKSPLTPKKSFRKEESPPAIAMRVGGRVKVNIFFVLVLSCQLIRVFTFRKPKFHSIHPMLFHRVGKLLGAFH